MAIWYYTSNGQQLGPVDEPQIRALAAGKRISPDDLVWQEGTADWVTAADAGLFGAVPVAAVAAAAPVPLTYATPTITEKPVIGDDPGPFYKIGSQYRIGGTLWSGAAVVSSKAFYLLKRRSHVSSAHFGLVGALLQTAIAGVDDLRTCDLNDLPQAVRDAMGRAGRKKSGNVIVLPREAVHLVKTRGFDTIVHVRIGVDKFRLSAGLFSKGKARRFLVANGWTIDQEVIPTAAPIHGNGFGRPFEEMEKLKPSTMKRVLYAALGIGIIVLWIVFEVMKN